MSSISPTTTIAPAQPGVPAPAPLYRDPIFDGPTDPTVIFHRGERSWWMLYTARRASGPQVPGVSWIHGTAIGIASSDDLGQTWTYRGTAEGLNTEWGHHTYWAPEVIDDGTEYHMYLTAIVGTPSDWAGHPRSIRHYTSDDLAHWTYRSTLPLSSPYVIDACVAALPGGGWRLWYKDEADGSTSWYADSDDLFSWRVGGRAVAHREHEGPNVFRLGGCWWMVVDEWRGQGVLRSDDLLAWEHTGLILDSPGIRPDDGTIGHHADVVPVTDDTATIFYFTHPRGGAGMDAGDPLSRSSSVQAAALRVVDGRLVCDRDVVTAPILPGTPVP